MELRFIIRDGKKILQYRDRTYYFYDEWKDVPLVEEKTNDMR